MATVTFSEVPMSFLFLFSPLLNSDFDKMYSVPYYHGVMGKKFCSLIIFILLSNYYAC